MTTTRRPGVPKPAAKTAAAKPAGLNPVDVADAAIGRRVREVLDWTMQLVCWVVSGLLTVVFYITFPEGGLVGALAMNAVAGLTLVLLILRWTRG